MYSLTHHRIRAVLITMLSFAHLAGEDGYRLWLRYDIISDTRILNEYKSTLSGIMVEGNSEGQPGPQKYGRTHAEGANLLARALAPWGGIVMWRAFVYDNAIPD